jgi:hypothetical protein
MDILERILTMLYVVQSYWASFGLYPSSCMWKTKDHNVTETGSLSVLRWIGQDKPIQLGPLERSSLKHWTNPDKVMLRPTVCLGTKHPFGAYDQNLIIV